jgi:hypothetical protein
MESSLIHTRTVAVLAPAILPLNCSPKHKETAQLVALPSKHCAPGACHTVFSALEFTVSAKWSSSCSLVQRARAFAYGVKGSADSRGSLLISSFSIDFLSGTDRHRSKVVRTSGPRWDF